MIYARRRNLLIATLIAICPTAWANETDDQCHKMAENGTADIGLFDGDTPMCTNKADLSPTCSALVRQMGAESTDNFVMRYFLVSKGPCKDATSVQAYCRFVNSYDGYQVLLNDGSLQADPSDPDYGELKNPLQSSMKLCATTAQEIVARLCATADKAKQWDFA